MFNDHSQPLVPGRRTVEMTETPRSGPSSTRSRPGALVLGKDQPFEIISDLAVLDEERVVVAGKRLSGDRRGSPRYEIQGVQVRCWPDLRVERELPAGGDVFDVRAPWVLASGAYSDGWQHHSGVWMDLTTGHVQSEFPVHGPFLITDGGFIGCMRRQYTYGGQPKAGSELVGRWPQLAPLFDSNLSLLVFCSWEGEVKWTLDVSTIAPGYPSVHSLVWTPEGDGLVVATTRSLAEVELKTGKVRWRDGWSDVGGTASPSLTSVACDATRVAVGGTSLHGNSSVFRVLERSTARLLLQDRATDGSDQHGLMFHGSTLLMGTASGRLLLYDEKYTRRELQLSKKSVNRIRVVRGGVLAACDKGELRFLPLLDDET